MALGLDKGFFESVNDGLLKEFRGNKTLLDSMSSDGPFSIN